ncbi:glutathione S-transferase N-terminal domain-containing protein [Nitrospirillum pindoramense]|uniref:Glutathione S-transferase n=1 Tax=Nitrospirillum amazonense TaxID=28077 RepID=A0A560HFM8_9PROT|nr:glutathione S-transferase N-terminal domain-containing protein [Nitrospirillum amazonense]TWB45237.1 glutathione S-transferase [Nitrospirillum amazonense]
MKLFYSQTSPFVRKALMVAHERGLASRIDLSPTDVWSPETVVPTLNPLGKIPTLVTDDGLTLFDSPVIAEYLDSLGTVGQPLFPAAGPARWLALRQQAIADGMCDAAILRRMEGLRPENLRSASWTERQRQAMTRAVDLLEAEVDQLQGLTIGTLSVVIALAYLDLRWDCDHWRDRAPQLAIWFTQASDRESFRLTVPPRG